MYMPVFGNLNTLPIRIWDEARIAINACEMNLTGDIWDEARIAINACEMNLTGDYLVTTFNFKPDMWNTKPPLLVWCMVLLMKTIGVNELAVRLPSAFAAFFTCLALLLFVRRYFKDDWFAILTVLVLITTNGYIHYHISRTGDYDALLTLFTTTSCLFFYAYCEARNTKFLYLFFISLTLGVLTKGIAAMLFGPALLVFCLLQKKLRLFIFNKHFYLGILIFLLFGVGYYFLRDHFNPGYLKAIQENELGGRYLQEQGDQDFDFWFYYHNLVDRQFSYWIILLPAGFITGWLSKEDTVRRFTLYLTLLIFSFFLIVSAAQTRLEQYIAPLFPLLALAVAVFLNQLFKWIRQTNVFVILAQFRFKTKQVSINVVPYVLLLIVFVYPYQNVWNKTYNVKEDFWWEEKFYEIGYFYQSALNGRYDLNNKYLLYDGYNAHVLFYVYALQDRGVKTLQRFFPDIKPGEELIVYQDNMKKVLHDQFIVSSVKVRGDVCFYKIISW